MEALVTGGREFHSGPSGFETVLAGDIGGTTTRIGLFAVSKGRCRLIVGRDFSSRDYEGLEEVLEDFLKGRKEVDSACFGVAGPVLGRIVRLTNLPWVIRTESLREKFSFRRVAMINDLVANAYGIRMLQKGDFEVLNVGKAGKGNVALISAGTGLGEAFLFWDGRRHVPSPSEGGHADFGPRNELEVKLFRYLFSRLGHVSYERILSGEGIFNIYQFLRSLKRSGREPVWLTKKMEQEDPAAVISEMARRKKDGVCAKALDLFTSIYGGAAGNLALQILAVGGVYIGGGIAPRVVWKMKDGTFMKAFVDKGRYSDLLGRIPVKVIMNDRAALLGAAAHAVNLLAES